MGIALSAVYMLGRNLPFLGTEHDRSVLTLGVQDCHFSYRTLERFFHRHGFSHREVQPELIESTSGFAWRRSVGDTTGYIHQRTLFSAWGFQPDRVAAMDASDYEGADLVHDLNDPIPDELGGRFDLIFDGGTLEHVFSVKDALFNVARLCRVGGYAVHHGPADYVNHGFYNLTAELFRDFYLRNGFEEVIVRYLAIPARAKVADRHIIVFEPERLKTFLHPRYRTSIFVIFRKVAEVELNVPQQGFYRNLWHADGDGRGRNGRWFVARRWIVERAPLFHTFLPHVARRLGQRVDL